jgi:hypothetical protein
MEIGAMLTIFMMEISALFLNLSTFENRYYYGTI